MVDSVYSLSFFFNFDTQLLDLFITRAISELNTPDLCKCITIFLRCLIILLSYNLSRRSLLEIFTFDKYLFNNFSASFPERRRRSAYLPISRPFLRLSVSNISSMLPMKSSLNMKFDYSMAMGVRYGDNERKAQLNKLISKNQQAINKILQSYHVPLQPIPEKKISEDDD